MLLYRTVMDGLWEDYKHYGKIGGSCTWGEGFGLGHVGWISTDPHNQRDLNRNISDLKNQGLLLLSDYKIESKLSPIRSDP